MHLTNYAINKLDPNFISNKDVYNDHKGHKRSYTSVIKYLRENDFDAEKIEERIDSIIVRTILAGYTKLLKSYKKTR
jgi:superfamily I DNA and RNA helicase